jgi:hypothetical protein
MASSQNGWPVVDHDACTDRKVCGAEFPNGWLKGDVDVIFTYLINRLHAEVEPINVGGCWGWYVKAIEGGSSTSNHASGTAIDYNAPAHPMGSHNTYSSADRDRIHSILSYLEGTVRWGGDYSGRPDDMHFEINKSKSAVKAVADKIRRNDMISDDDAEKIARAVHNQKLGGSTVTIGQGIQTTYNNVGTIVPDVNTLEADVAALKAGAASQDAAIAVIGGQVAEILALLNTEPTPPPIG